MAKKKPAAEPTPLIVESAPALDCLRELGGQLDTVQEPVADRLQAILNGLCDKSFGSLEANQAVIDAIQHLLHRLDMRVECRRCGKPAIPRCRATSNTKDGSFQFEHSSGGRQTNHGGGTTFPALSLVPAPPDRRRVRKKKRRNR